MPTLLWTPRMTVATIVRKNNRFLIVEESVIDRKGTVFNQPAGHIEPGESVFSAAKRETLEETGWEVELTALSGIYINNGDTENLTYHRTCFIAKPIRENHTFKLSPEIKQVHWLTLEEINENLTNHRSILVKRCIDDYLSGQSFPLTFLADLR